MVRLHENQPDWRCQRDRIVTEGVLFLVEILGGSLRVTLSGLLLNLRFNTQCFDQRCSEFG